MHIGISFVCVVTNERSFVYFCRLMIFNGGHNLDLVATVLDCFKDHCISTSFIVITDLLCQLLLRNSLHLLLLTILHLFAKL